MRYSKIFGKTNKSAKEYDSINATLLIKAGFVDQTMAGVYTFLPLGLRVLDKIEKIIREEMDKIGSELLMPGLAPKELWEISGRAYTADVLFKAMGANEESLKRNDTEYILNPTHEEVITPIAKGFNVSHKDLPFAVYQIQTKYRNEARPKSGLLRGREFRMKDLYSFDKSEAGLKEFYEVAKQAYFTIFERLGFDEVIFAAASGGDFTEEFSHEFQVRCDAGEDLIFYSKEDKVAFNREIAPSLAPEPEKEKPKERQEVLTENVTGVKELSDFLKVPAYKTVKTIIYETENGPIAAAVRGDYEINEEKLKKSAHVKTLKLAGEETVKKLTNAEIGYAGIVNLPEKTPLFLDEALKYLTNFETGANKTNYHLVNVNWYRDLEPPEVFFDLKVAKEGDLYPDTGRPYEVFKGSEVGNIFPLNTKFSKAFEYYYTDQNGAQQPVYMGSYGIGSSRIMGVMVEKFHDNKGIVWPEQVAPFRVHLIGLNTDDKEVALNMEHAINKFNERGIEFLYDDREGVTAGEKFADADLIGIPYRAVVSAKTKEKIEVKKRNEDKVHLLTLDEFINNLIK